MSKIFSVLAMMTASVAFVTSAADATTYFPVSNAGGPYSFYTSGSGNEPFTVDASASYSPSGLPLTYAWDLNGDGLFNEGSTAVLTVPGDFFANAPAGTVFNVAVRVSDLNGSIISFATATSLGPAPVPETATWAMMLMGLGGMGLLVRRRRTPQSYSPDPKLARAQ